MNWSNYHSHCTFCDGRSTMEEFVKFAIAKGVKKYGFSSHAPLPFNTFWNMKVDDFDEYIAEFNRLKQKYSSEIELFVGLEVDYIHDLTFIQNELYDSQKLDFLIGSVHYMDHLPNGDLWTVDGNFTDFETGLKILFDGDINAAVKRFFEISSSMIQKGGFDLVGHFDKIAMNASNCKDFNVNDTSYKNRIGEILQLIKKKDLILEINTKSFNTLGITYPNQLFFGLIHDLEIHITVNSDCHYPTNIIEGFQQIYFLLKKAGFNTVTQMQNGNWIPFEFDENGVQF